MSRAVHPCTVCGTPTSGRSGLCRKHYLQQPARARSGSFGQFQLNPSHLITERDAWDTAMVSPSVARAAAVVVARHVERDEILDVLAMLGLTRDEVAA